MRNVMMKVRARWNATGVGGRMWWGAASSLAVAAVLVLGATSLTDAAGSGAVAAPSNGSSTSTTGGSGSMTGMPGMSGRSSAGTGATGTGSAGAGSATSPASTTASICPNVTGTTTMGNGMVMAPVPAGAPTAAEQAAANTLVAQTTAAVARYANLSAATAAGYVPATDPNGYEVHYANWQIVRSGDVLDPNHPSSLVYANTVKGPVLLGAMYLGAGPCIPGPDVGGPLTQWHAHDNLCLSATHQVVGKTDASGACATGVHNTSTYFMLHVWVAPSLAATHQFQPDLTRAELAPIIRTGQG
ncbi:MAG: hypothetical protein ABSH29_10255 [Acidimicrobiales bacterium]